MAGGEKRHCGRFYKKNSEKIAALVKIFDRHLGLELLQPIQPGILLLKVKQEEGLQWLLQQVFSCAPGFDLDLLFFSL